MPLISGTGLLQSMWAQLLTESKEQKVCNMIFIPLMCFYIAVSEPISCLLVQYNVNRKGFPCSPQDNAYIKTMNIYQK